MQKKILKELIHKKENGIKSLAVLIDPDKISEAKQCIRLINLCVENRVDYFFIGGSLVRNRNLGEIIKVIKSHSNIPAILFPGNVMQIDASADAILFLSLISGRNPELLIGQHVVAAPFIKKSSLEVLPTGYLLIDSGRPTAASYMSNTLPIPNNKPNIAASTAMAGEMLGLQLIYLDAGSGATNTVPRSMIAQVNEAIKGPLIVGGGIRSGSHARDIVEAGADVLVIGNGVEEDLNLLIEISDIINHYNESLNIH